MAGRGGNMLMLWITKSNPDIYGNIYSFFYLEKIQGEEQVAVLEGNDATNAEYCVRDAARETGQAYRVCVQWTGIRDFRRRVKRYEYVPDLEAAINQVARS
jgi:hypothetical protein